jgi:acetyltransferase-like isoleucine patch superfamily enzyme
VRSMTGPGGLLATSWDAIHIMIRGFNRGFDVRWMTWQAISAVPPYSQEHRVVIGSNVEIGANSCVDRGSWRDTVIGDDTKIDNLVQIGHNVTVGRGCLLCGGVALGRATQVNSIKPRQSLASTKFGRYGSYLAVVWAIHVGIGRT